jgi:tetratricopeptide (TPR) repeat protein
MNPMEVLLTEAEACLSRGELDRAAEIYRRAPEVDGGKSLLPTVGTARVAMLLKRYQDAALIVEALLALHPTFAPALTVRGLAAEGLGHLDEAKAWLARSVEVEPRSAVAWFNLGRVQAQLQDTAAAVTSLRKAVALEPDQAASLGTLGLVAFRAGLHDEAVRALTQSLALDPDRLDAYVTLADALAGLRQDATADELLANAQRRFPDAVVLFARRAALAVRRNDTATARAMTVRHTELAPDDAAGWLALAVLEAADGRFSELEAAARKATAADVHDWNGPFQLGVALEAQRRKPEAIAAYRLSLARGPEQWRPANNLAALLLESDAPSTVREVPGVLEKALVSVPGEERFLVQYNLAMAWWKLQERSRSHAAARHAAQGPAGHPVVADATRFLKNF